MVGHKPRYNLNREYENEINKMRVEENLTLRELSNILNISQGYLQIITQGLCAPYHLNGTIKKWAIGLSEYFNTELSYIFPREICDINRNGLIDEQIKDILNPKVSFNPEMKLKKKINKKVVSKILATISPRQEYVIRLYFGIGYDEHNYTEIAKIMNRSKHRIAQILNQGLRLLRHPTRTNKLWV